jgi:pimeloyl-ACP methyl ester carboxylesterase
METNNQTRRHFLNMAAMTIAATQFGSMRLAIAQAHNTTAWPGSEGSLGGANPLGPIKQINAGLLNVGYAESGPADGPPVILLHGWHYAIYSYVDVAPILVSRGYRVIVPYLRGFGTTRFLSDQTIRNGQQAAIALDIIALMDALSIEKAIIAGFDWGARAGDVMAALWPERCKAIVSVSGYLIINLQANLQPLSPIAERGWWYQYYFATERGELGYAKNKHDFNKLIWKLASPKWNFNDATYDRSALSFDNPDHVSIVIHNYRWRLSIAPGESQYDHLEQKLSAGPAITVPAITISSDFDGLAADGKSYAGKFTGRYSHQILDGIGHNVPQEAPRIFADAIIAVDGYSH